MMMPVAIAFACTVILMVVLAPLAYHTGLVAEPGEHRHHDKPTPLIGGIAIFLALLVTSRFSDLPVPQSVWIAMAVVMVFGVVDDRWTVPFWIRFAVQILAAYIMVRDGIVLRDLGHLTSHELFTLGRWQTPLTIFSVVGVINAVNMIDGMDGLAGVVLCVALASIAILSVGHDPGTVQVCLAMIACLAGFLLFNLRFPGNRSARAFLGDAGSMVLGVFVSWLLVARSQGVEAGFSPVVAIWILAIPLYDTVGVMLRRMFNRVSPFHADRTHTHHFLQLLGMGTNPALLVMASAAVIFSAIGVAGHMAGIPEHTLFIAFLVLFGLYLVSIEIGFKRI